MNNEESSLDDYLEIQEFQKHSSTTYGNKQIKTIVFYALYLSIIMVMSLVPFLGYISIGVITINLLPIIIIIGTIHLGVHGAIYTSSVVGIFGYVSAMTTGTGLLAFTNLGLLFIPVVLGRVLMGFVIAAIWKSLEKTNYKIKGMVIAIITPMINTLIFLPLMYFVTSDKMSNGLYWWFSISSINILVEWLTIPYVGFMAIPTIKHFKKVGN